MGETPNSSQSRPLDGVVVVSLEQAVAAPMCSRMLANAGARVIKVERPEGDFARGYDDVVHSESAYFVWLNGGKESIRIDLKSAADNAFLSRLVFEADIFIQNLLPGAAARHGFGSDQLRAANPRLITLDISGYGEGGDYAQMKAYDLLIQGESGLASITGTDEAPGRIGVSICDIACGMYGYSAILEALIKRATTNEGDSLKVSLFDAAAHWMTVPLLHQQYGSAAPRRVGLRHPSIAPYGVFTAAGQRSLLIAVQNDREWKEFCSQVMRQPELASMPLLETNVARVANRAVLDRMIEAVLGKLDEQELIQRLKAANIAFGRVNSVADLAKHPQLRWTEIESPSGPVKLVADPVRRGSWQPRGGKSPALGEHDLKIHTEFATSGDLGSNAKNQDFESNQINAAQG